MRIEIKQIEIHFVCETLQRGAWGRQEGGGGRKTREQEQKSSTWAIWHTKSFSVPTRDIFLKRSKTNERKKRTARRHPFSKTIFQVPHQTERIDIITTCARFFNKALTSWAEAFCVRNKRLKKNKIKKRANQTYKQENAGSSRTWAEKLNFWLTDDWWDKKLVLNCRQENNHGPKGRDGGGEVQGGTHDFSSKPQKYEKEILWRAVFPAVCWPQRAQVKAKAKAWSLKL